MGTVLSYKLADQIWITLNLLLSLPKVTYSKKKKKAQISFVPFLVICRGNNSVPLL